MENKEHWDYADYWDDAMATYDKWKLEQKMEKFNIEKMEEFIDLIEDADDLADLDYPYASMKDVPQEIIDDAKNALENSPDHKAHYHNGSYEFDPSSAWIQTYSGRRFCPLNPSPNAIVIQDIAHSLSMQCRFNGHCKKFYSVAEHSVYVSYLCDRADAMHGLLHDGSEAYLSDFASPLKLSGKFQSYIEYEAILQKAIYKRFGIIGPEPKSVKDADKLMLAIEASQLINPRSDLVLPKFIPPFKVSLLQPEEAEKLFIDRFYELLAIKQ